MKWDAINAKPVEIGYWGPGFAKTTIYKMAASSMKKQYKTDVETILKAKGLSDTSVSVDDLSFFCKDFLAWQAKQHSSSDSSSSGPTSVVDTTTGTTTSRNNNQNYHKKLKNRKNPEGAPSRYLEYEGPDATYLIRLGKHPTISYPNLKDFTDTEIRIVYHYNPFNVQNQNQNANNAPSKGKAGQSSSLQVLQVDDCPRHFLWLSDQTIQKELDYKLENGGRWSERTLLEKSYFTLFYGSTGLASQYMDYVDDFQTDLIGWDIMNRSSNHCDWEGIDCATYLEKRIIIKNKSKTNSRISKIQPGPQPVVVVVDEENENKMILYQNVSYVISFAINGFSLEGRLPTDLYQLSYLKTLDLHGNMIRGTIPNSWGNLKNLQLLNLCENLLTGTLPSSLIKWTNIQSLLLGSNLLTGTIPKQLIESWTNKKKHHPVTNVVAPPQQQVIGLQVLDLYNNKFTGQFPFTTLLQYGKHLQLLNLGNNMFTGTLPSAFFHVNVTANTNSNSDNPNNIANANANANANSDAISDNANVNANANANTIASDSNALPIDKSHRRRAGSSSSSSSITSKNNSGNNNGTGGGGLSRLEIFNLSYNQISGPIPKDWWKIVHILKIWNLSHNQLSGSIPGEIMLIDSLQLLDMSYNKLTGTIPQEQIEGGFRNPKKWLNLKDLYSLLINNNFVSGTIPNEFLYGLSPALIELDLADNLLDGTLPSSLGRMSKLERFDIHNNTIIGTLPSEMNRMYPDIKLNLTDNLLTGTVPKIFCGGGAMSSSILFRQFGCDAIICPPGTYHPDGAAKKRFRFLIEWDPTELIRRDEYGCVPLDYAAINFPSIEMFRFILECGMRYFPKKKGISLPFQEDMDNETPFQEACKKYGHEQVMMVISDTLNNPGTPPLNSADALLSAAIDGSIHLDCVYLLVRREPDVLQKLLSQSLAVVTSAGSNNNNNNNNTRNDDGTNPCKLVENKLDSTTERKRKREFNF
ncbi:RNI-like protein [Fragilariopsis cylindrus CCMP1102]|uniref:RNI-like protein n=1 Tax=Fragilariopsis cylindrus CCMP1102 TaxID=635003 RepID=A0A1E7EYV1_9STRA|nr:RNI-like protein [Fragilariopsis cylindrus CCMP1102]|eukprot:OEU11037.1 RNI-like protein [Fragilariopsis cylindrus CCMP1102]